MTHQHGVVRPGHLQLRVLEMQPALDHYLGVVGLLETGRDDQGRVYLKAWDEHDWFSLVLREAESPGMDHFAFRVSDAATLRSLGQSITAWGLPTELIPAGELRHVGERLSFVVPTGHRIELFAEKDKFGNGLPLLNPDVVAPGLKGMRPSRLDHCLVWGDEIQATADFFQQVLGFGLSEQILAGEGGEMIGAFLTRTNKPHDIAFIKADGKNWFHHVGFYVDSIDDMRAGNDLIAVHEIPVEYNGRHGITRGHTTYFFDPSGNRNEIFHGGYIYYPDHPTLTWTDPEKGIFYYGRKMIDSFMTAHT